MQPIRQCVDNGDVARGAEQMFTPTLQMLSATTMARLCRTEKRPRSSKVSVQRLLRNSTSSSKKEPSTGWRCSERRLTFRNVPFQFSAGFSLSQMLADRAICWDLQRDKADPRALALKVRSAKNIARFCVFKSNMFVF